MVVSAVMPVMSIYWLQLGQYEYTGHVINLPQDVVSFANSLPRVPSEDLYGAHLSTSFVPNAYTAEDRARDCAAVHSRPTEWIISHPYVAHHWRSTDQWIHHWRIATYGLPHLVSNRSCRLLGQRCNQVTIGNYFTHLLKYDDGRFARHIQPFVSFFFFLSLKLNYQSSSQTDTI